MSTQSSTQSNDCESVCTKRIVERPDTTGLFHYLGNGVDSKGLSDSTDVYRLMFTRWQSDIERPPLPSAPVTFDKLRTHHAKLRAAFFHAIENDPVKAKEYAATMAGVKSATAKVLERKQVTVHNARSQCIDEGLSTTGFTLQQHTSQLTDWDDEEQLRTVYLPEIESFVKVHTGAAFAFSNSYVLRCAGSSSGAVGGANKKTQGGLATVHNDYTQSYLDELVAAMRLDPIAETEAAAVERTERRNMLLSLAVKVRGAGVTVEDLRERYQVVVVNAWRHLGDDPRAVESCPLAVCDNRTVAAEDLVVAVNGGQENPFARHSPRHAWYWYPRMTRKEVLLFKTADSESPLCRSTIHCAFYHSGEDSGAFSGAVGPRRSCEVRVVCLIPKTRSSV